MIEQTRNSDLKRVRLGRPKKLKFPRIFSRICTMAVEFRMEHLELKPSDLADILGGRNRVSEILKQEKEADSRDDAVFAQTPRYPR